MRIDDIPALKIYREHNTDINAEDKASQQGCIVTDQSEETTLYTTENQGDEQGWLWWGANTRAIGSYAQLALAIVSRDGYILPVHNHVLTGDVLYAEKQLITTTAADDPTKVLQLGGDAPEVGEIGLVVQSLNDESHEQFFFPLTAGGDSTRLARVRWNCALSGDFSEAEIVSLDEFDNIIASGEVVWISWRESKSCRFESAGNATLFEIKLSKNEETRGTITRSLYSVVRTRRDEGYKITHGHTIAKDFSNNRLICELLSTEKLSPVWSAPLASRIVTTIAGNDGENILPMRLSSEWIIDTENYNYVEPADYQGFGAPMLFRPIRPVKYDNTTLIYTSAETLSGVTIAHYEKAE